MKMRNILSTIMLVATIAAPVFISNTAQADDDYYSGHSRGEYRHGYRDGYRDSNDDERHHRRRARHHYEYDYSPHVVLGHGYAGHGGRHGYRRGHGYGHRSGIDLIFRF